jgi:cell division transport system ATP-binding protein
MLQCRCRGLCDGRDRDGPAAEELPHAGHEVPSPMDGPMDGLVVFDDVSVRYGGGPDVLKGLRFTLPKGSFHFLVGPSGAGKSSLLRLMYLALRPTTGSLRLFGRDVKRMTRDEVALTRRHIGVIFQDFQLLEHLTAFDNVALPLRVAGAREGRIREHVTELLNWVGLASFLRSYPPTMSGGQQQRVAIARAVIAQPSLLLADEPTGNVDDTIAVRLMYLFEELNKMGTTVVIATHNEGLVSRFGHPQLRLEHARVRVVDPLLDVA